MNEYSHLWSEVAAVTVACLLIGAAVGGDSVPPAQRRVSSTKLSLYECFFAALLLGIIGMLLCFELLHLNQTPKEIVTQEVERLGGRIQFASNTTTGPAVVIDFGGKPIGNADLVCLERLSRVDTLDLSRTSVTDAGLRRIGELSSLYELDLSHTAVTDAGLRTLRNVHGLRRLDLTATRVTDSAIDDLSALSKLQELNLEYTDVGDATVRALMKCPTLKTLRIGNTRVSPEALAALRSERPDMLVTP